MPETTEPRTKVIFRMFRKGGDIIALFPEIPGTSDPGTCMSYQSIGQHGAATMSIIDRATVPAKPEEFEPLRRELENHVGYRLKLVTRKTAQMDRERLKALRQLSR